MRLVLYWFSFYSRCFTGVNSFFFLLLPNINLSGAPIKDFFSRVHKHHTNQPLPRCTDTTGDVTLTMPLQLSHLQLPNRDLTQPRGEEQNIWEKDKPVVITFLPPQFTQPLPSSSPRLPVMSAVARALICGYYGVLECDFLLLTMSSERIGLREVRGRVCLQGLQKALCVREDLRWHVVCQVLAALLRKMVKKCF